MLATLCALTVLSAATGGPPADEAALRRDGAFGFPQKDATVLCDTPAMRLSAFNDADYLYVQAVLFSDGDDALGETDDGREIGDNSDVLLDVDADGKATPNLDRGYMLNPWPSLPGLRYDVVMSENSTTGIKSDSKGHGAISYLPMADGRKIRVDSYLIPLEEVSRKPGDTVRLAYYGSSTHPDLVVNSVGFTSPKKYYPHHLPRKDYHRLVLAERPASLDIQAVPEGRGQIALEAKPAKPVPEVGSAPPDVGAGAWLNWSGAAPPSLSSLKGKVVVVEFWATWCGPCVEGIPHLNELHDKLSKDGLVILSLTDQKKEHVEQFMTATPMRYTVGVRSKTADEYGVTGIPHAFVIARNGTLVWNGHPQSAEFGKAIENELARK